ncbi:MAG TPA: histidine kinase N-terminal domain-containing protein [Anaerolineae bacterium]|nr:histidine kinase N-terminal domain-containing protein [Anaerolineae bacterium]
MTLSEVAFLDRLKTHIGVLADLCRSDILIYCPAGIGRAVVAAQARPHSIVPIHTESLLGRPVTPADAPAVFRALEDGRRTVMEAHQGETGPGSSAQRAPIVQDTYPVRAREGGTIIAALAIETNLIERERHHRRSRVFRRALRLFREQVQSGTLRGVEALSPFGEHDGIVYIDSGHHIQYVSGIATSLYRKLGYTASLLRRHFEDLELDDGGPVREAFETGACVEREIHVRDLVWIKKAIPLMPARPWWRAVTRREAARRPEGVLVTISDETEARRQQEEARVKVAMIQEIYHRVKNNLQTIASLLRMQARRAGSDEVRVAIEEGVTRILAVAVIHEFLAHQEASLINIRDVSQRIISMFREGVVDHGKSIRLDLRGPNIYLPTGPATVSALVINELLQNALEHGFEHQEGGSVTVSLRDDGDQVTIAVEDDGIGLPDDFDLEQTSSLGIKIVKTLATGDLRGRFELQGRDKGVAAVVTFPKQQGGK